MVLVKTQHTEVSFDLSLNPSPQELAVHVSLSVFNFQTACTQTRRQIFDPVKPTGPNALPVSEARQQRRSAAAPSRWAVYRRDPFLLSTAILKVFRQKTVLYGIQIVSRRIRFLPAAAPRFFLHRSAACALPCPLGEARKAGSEPPQDGRSASAKASARKPLSAATAADVRPGA